MDFTRYRIPGGWRGGFGTSWLQAGWAPFLLRAELLSHLHQGARPAGGIGGSRLGVLLPFLDIMPTAQSERMQSLPGVGCPLQMPVHCTSLPARGKAEAEKTRSVYLGERVSSKTVPSRQAAYVYLQDFYCSTCLH